MISSGLLLLADPESVREERVSPTDVLEDHSHALLCILQSGSDRVHVRVRGTYMSSYFRSKSPSVVSRAENTTTTTTRLIVIASHRGVHP